MGPDSRAGGARGAAMGTQLPDLTQQLSQRPAEKSCLVFRILQGSPDGPDVLLESYLWIEHVGLGKPQQATGFENALDLGKREGDVHVVENRVTDDGVAALGWATQREDITYDEKGVGMAQAPVSGKSDGKGRYVAADKPEVFMLCQHRFR